MAKKKTTKGAAQQVEGVQETPEVSQNVEAGNEAASTADSNESAVGGSEENSEASESSSSEEKKEGREPEVPGSVTKFFKFETSAPRTFDLDGGFIKVALEKRVRVKAYIAEDSGITFKEILDAIEEKKYRLKMHSVGLDPAKEPSKGFFMVGRGYPIADLYIPLTKNSSRTIDGIKSFLVGLSNEIKGVNLRYKIETVAQILVDTSKEHKNVILKGFLAGACVTNKNRRDDTIELVPEFRGQMYMDKQTNLEIRDVMNMNEVIETNKVRLYTVGDERNEWNYPLPLSKMLAIASYQVVGVTPKGKLKVQRVLARIRIRNVSVAGIVVPVGVFISMRKDIISAKKIENFFVDVASEHKNVSFLETYGDMPIDELVEYSSLKQDFDVIDRVIMDSITVVDQSTTEESEPAPETPQPETEAAPETQEADDATGGTEEEKSSEEVSA